jgi:hypothetical protein
MTALVSPVLLPGFEYRRMDVGGVMVNHAIAGSGPPLPLPHGYPENHLMWRHVAPGAALPTGHFLPEEAPDLVTAALRDFFA